MIEAVLATENSLQASEMSLLSVFLAKIEFQNETNIDKDQAKEKE